MFSCLGTLLTICRSSLTRNTLSLSHFFSQTMQSVYEDICSFIIVIVIIIIIHKMLILVFWLNCHVCFWVAFSSSPNPR